MVQQRKSYFLSIDKQFYWFPKLNYLIRCKTVKVFLRCNKQCLWFAINNIYDPSCVLGIWVCLTKWKCKTIIFFWKKWKSNFEMDWKSLSSSELKGRVNEKFQLVIVRGIKCQSISTNKRFRFLQFQIKEFKYFQTK
jgi:hypothetical protein